MHITVMGAGSFGTALACLATAHHPTLLWARRPELVKELDEHYENVRYLPGIALPRSLAFTADIHTVMSHALGASSPPLFILAVPVAGLREAAQMLAQAFVAHSDQEINVVWTCKGFVNDTQELPHQVMYEVFKDLPHVRLGVLSGPSFAKEVAQGLPMALAVASDHEDLVHQMTRALHSESCRLYHTNDVIGVEVGGALKNIIAIACGIADGLSLGLNARAALITRGLVEMTRYGVALGARPETLQGLAGLGDLILTATGDLSRNRRVGIAIGQGQTLSDILDSMPHVAEGVNCAKTVLALSQSLGVSMPITEAVCAVLFDDVNPRLAVGALMSRNPRPEV